MGAGLTSAEKNYYLNSIVETYANPKASALKRDPVDKGNGFVKSPARNLITALHAYGMDDGGFKHLMSDTKSSNMSNIQALMAFEAYRRCRTGADTLFDLTGKETPDKLVNPSDPSAPESSEPVKPTTPTAPVKPEAPDTSTPITGDDTNIVFYGMMLTASMLALAALSLQKKKRFSK